MIDDTMPGERLATYINLWRRGEKFEGYLSYDTEAI